MWFGAEKRWRKPERFRDGKVHPLRKILYGDFIIGGGGSLCPIESLLLGHAPHSRKRLRHFSPDDSKFIPSIQPCLTCLLPESLLELLIIALLIQYPLQVRQPWVRPVVAKLFVEHAVEYHDNGIAVRFCGCRALGIHIESLSSLMSSKVLVSIFHQGNRLTSLPIPQ